MIVLRARRGRCRDRVTLKNQKNHDRGARNSSYSKRSTRKNPSGSAICPGLYNRTDVFTRFVTFFPETERIEARRVVNVRHVSQTAVSADPKRDLVFGCDLSISAEPDARAGIRTQV